MLILAADPVSGAHFTCDIVAIARAPAEDAVGGAAIGAEHPEATAGDMLMAVASGQATCRSCGAISFDAAEAVGEHHNFAPISGIDALGANIAASALRHGTLLSVTSIQRDDIVIGQLRQPALRIVANVRHELISPQVSSLAIAGRSLVRQDDLKTHQVAEGAIPANGLRISLGNPGLISARRDDGTVIICIIRLVGEDMKLIDAGKADGSP